MVSARRAAVLLLAAGLVLTSTGAAGAQAPTPSPPSSGPTMPGTGTPGPATTYGFDDACDQLHDLLSQLPVVGKYDGDVLSGMCKAGNAATHPGKAADTVRSKVWDSTFGQIVESLLDGLGEAVGAAMTMWTKLPNDKLLDSPTLWQRIDSYTRVLQVWVLAISIAISALRIGVARRHMASEHAEETFRMLARSVIATWIAGGAILAGARITDRFSQWLLADTIGSNGTGAAELLVKSYRNSAGLLSPGLVFVVALVGLLGALSMAALTVIRQAFLVVAVGIFPLTAAASGTAAGRQSFTRLAGWVVAFLLFKPIASLIYMIAFVTADQTNTESAQNAGSADSAARSLIGIVLLCSAAFVLPALVRLVAPGLSMIGSGGSGAVATGLAAGAAAVAVTGGKALLSRPGTGTGTGAARSTTIPDGGPPPSTHFRSSTPNRPPLPPAPPRGGGGAPPRGPGGAPRGAPEGGVTRASAPTGLGRSVERAGHDTATGSGSSGGSGSAPGWVNPDPNLGDDHIDR